MVARPERNALGEATDGELVFSPLELLRILRRRLWIIALAVVLCLSAAVGLTLLQTPRYEASIKVLVGQTLADEQPSSNLGSDVQGLVQLTRTVAEAINSRPVAEAVIDRLDLRMTLERFFENLTVEQIPETQFVRVSYTDPDPQRAQRVANAVGEEFADQISDLRPSANAITATVWEQAVVPNEPVSPDPLRYGLLALVLGLAMGLGLALLLEYRDDTWRSPEEAERVTGVPTFGSIPKFEVRRGKQREG